jgi:TonB family protein
MLQADTSNTTNEEARKNYVAWLKNVRDVKPEQVNLTGVYPQDACIRKLEGSAAYGVTVNPQGKVTDSQLIKSAGYPLFNQQALQQIQARSFVNATGNPKAFHVYVNFDYNPDICPSLTLSRIKAGPIKPPSNPSPSRSEPSSKPEQPQQQSTPAATNSSPKSPGETGEVKPSLTPPTAETQPQQSPKSPTATSSPPTVTETEANPNPQKQPENSQSVKSELESPSPSAERLSQAAPLTTTPEPPPGSQKSKVKSK